jgi:acyl carrier protein
MKMVAMKDVTLVSSTIDRDLRDILAAKLQVDTDQLAGVMTLGELGFDSLGLSDLAEAIEDRFGIQVPNRMLPSTLTVNQLVDLLCRSNEQAEDGQITAEAAD